MKRILTLILVLSSLNAVAKAPEKKSSAKKGCEACENAASLTKEIEKLNYSKDDDRFKGGEKSRAAVKQLQDFDQLSKTSKERLSIFKNLLVLSREAAPYDEEGQIADVLADILKRDATLKGEFAAYAKTMPKAAKAESCKSELFSSNVNEALCEQEKGLSGQDIKSEKDAKTCVSKFNFDDCLKKK